MRTLSNTLNAFEMMTIRSAGGLAILLVMAALQPELRHSVRAQPHGPAGPSQRRAFRLADLLDDSPITMLPFATVFALEFTIPAFVAVLAVLFLGERMTAHRATALVACFIGVLVILRPGFGGVPAGHADHDRRRLPVRDRRDRDQEADHDGSDLLASCSG